MDFLHVRIPLSQERLVPEDPRSQVRTATPVGRRPRVGVPSPPSRCPVGQRRSAPTLTLRCKRYGQSPEDHQVLGSGTRTPAPTAGSTPEAKVPIRLTVRQEEYCRQAVDIHRFCYNLAVQDPPVLPPQPAASGPAGWTSARPSTPASGRTTPSSPRSQPLWPPAPSGTSARPWTIGGGWREICLIGDGGAIQRPA